jgi:hypothetical protein
MTSTITSSITRIVGESTAKSEAPVTRAYRTKRSFAAVQFEPAGKGRIVFLPQGAELLVIGSSRLCECFEVLFENQLYNIFKEDLLGPCSTPIKSNSIKPIPALVAIGACA